MLRRGVGGGGGRCVDNGACCLETKQGLRLCAGVGRGGGGSVCLLWGLLPENQPQIKTVCLVGGGGGGGRGVFTMGPVA